MAPKTLASFHFWVNFSFNVKLDRVTEHHVRVFREITHLISCVVSSYNTNKGCRLSVKRQSLPRPVRITCKNQLTIVC